MIKMIMMTKRLTISVFFVTALIGGLGIHSLDAADDGETFKKFRIELSAGVGRADPREIYDRGAGIDTVISQYSQYYQLTDSATGEFKENKLFIPLSLAVNYFFSETFFVRAGIDYSGNSTTSQKVYQVAWPDFNENHDYEFTNKLSYVMPHVGVGYSGKQFDIYASLGAGISSFTHTEALNYSEPGYSHRITDTFELKGTGIGVILGGRYNLPLPKSLSRGSFKAFVKLEAVLLNVGTLTGTKVRSASNSTGNQSTETTEGTLYQHTWNPYSTRGFAWWDVFDTLPADPAVTGIEEMGLNLSGIRVMIGISF